MGQIDRTGQLAGELNRMLAEMSDRIVVHVTSELGRTNLSGDLRATDAATIRIRVAEHILQTRRLRSRFFPLHLFHEPAWHMLLELHLATARNREVCVKDLVAASDGPATTAVRWIDHLERTGLLRRESDPVDRRRMVVAITDDARANMDAYLDEIAASLGVAAA